LPEWLVLSGGRSYGGGVEPFETTGDFWAVDTDSRTAKGTLTWEPGEQAVLRLESRIVDALASPVTFTQHGYSIDHSADPARIVADHQPRVLLGDTAAGLVTGVDSYMRRSMGLGQVWDLQTLVVGAHLPAGNSTRVEAVRFVLDSDGWWEHLPDNGAAMSDAGEVVCERIDGELMWLEFRPSSELTLRSADRAVRSVITLMKLAVDVDLTPQYVQVREPGQTLWLKVKTQQHDHRKVSWPAPGNLLPPSSVALERIAGWLTIEQTMDGLAAAVANPVEKQAMQVQALVACSLIEGIHKRIEDAGERPYVERASDLHSIALRIVPDLTDPQADWAKLVKNARHDLAHHNTGRSFEEQWLNWMIVESSAIWVLRLCLLSHAGFTDREIADALADHQRYDFYRENLKTHVKERDAL
jgi:hypothetical protein